MQFLSRLALEWLKSRIYGKSKSMARICAIYFLYQPWARACWNWTCLPSFRDPQTLHIGRKGWSRVRTLLMIVPRGQLLNEEREHSPTRQIEPGQTRTPNPDRLSLWIECRCYTWTILAVYLLIWKASLTHLLGCKTFIWSWPKYPQRWSSLRA